MRWTTYNEWPPISLSKQQPDCLGLGFKKPVSLPVEGAMANALARNGKVVNRESAFGNWHFRRRLLESPR